MSWWNYVVATAGTDNQSEIARTMGISQPSISQWKTSRPKPETVEQFANAYKVPYIKALIAAGYITDKQAGEYCD